MKKCETGCFAMGARGARTIARLKFLSAEAVQMAATIKKSFGELGI